MPFGVQRSNELLKPVEDMAFSLELKKMRPKEQQSSSKIAKGRFDLPKSKNGVSPPCFDPNHKVRQDADSKIYVQPTGNNSWQSVKGIATKAKSDELVKHMSNLPGYLQCADRDNDIQESPLNFGVLDWAQLEKWKHKQKCTPSQARNFTSFNGCESSSRKATNSSSAVGIKASHKEGLTEGAKPYFRNVKQFQHFETEEKRKDLDTRISEVGNFASRLRHNNENKNGRDGEAEKSIESLHKFNLKKKERNRKFTYDMGLPSSKFKSKGVFAEKKSSSSSETKTKVDQLLESDIDADHKQCHTKPDNIVILRPREIPQLSYPEIFEHSQRRISFDEILAESSQSSLSNVSLPEDINSEGISEIPHSRELCSMIEPAATLETMQHSIDTDQYTDYSSVEPETPRFRSNLQSEGAYFENDALDIKLTNQCDFSNLKESLDQETAELTARRGRNPSTSHRFSFSLSRIGRSFSFREGSTLGRSFSFKERSTLPQFSSTYVSAKSGPVTAVSSARWDNSSKEKANGHNRTRSSPLRRLLDPILKRKTSNIQHSAESTQAQKGSLDSISFRSTSVGESLQDEKSEVSSIQALLQVTINDGLPLFKFVINNERKFLAAATKSLASPDKDDSSCYFTFYQLNEIKKKSGGWISHRNKEKRCGFVYNVVGQIKFSSSTITEPSNQNSKQLSVLKEYVLLGVEIDQTDQGPPKFTPSQELAAVVVKIPCENFIHRGLQRDNNLKKGCVKCLAEDRCMCNSGENDISGSTTVILPGGIHSSPNKGEPSPLIDRWKAGGSCDCGGWDIGCKLLVLSNPKQSSKSYLEPFQLFVKEGAEQNSPPFTLVPLRDGFYSVEFNSSVTNLQAFFISVVVSSCQKLSGSLEMTDMHEENFKEPSSLKNNNRLLGKAPVKYTPIPPLSPAGRV